MPLDLPPQLPATLPAVVELRQYTLKPGRREELVALFDRYFATGQAGAGIRVLGQFRDRASPDRFVWLRGFRDMDSRARSLEAFYGGAVWKEHRNAANDTMVDVSDVLLLAPVRHAEMAPGARVVATVHRLRARADDALVKWLEERAIPALEAAGAGPVAILRTEPAANNFPRLPVREGEQVLVWITSFPGEGAWRSAREALAASTAWREVQARMESLASAPAQVLELEPTPRSRWGGEVTTTGHLGDFDFIPGTWKVANRRLRRRGIGATDWDEFPHEFTARRMLGGVMNVDEGTFPTMGWSGASIRTFDRNASQWSIYWVNSRLGTMLPPVVGGFRGERGEFYGTDDDDGRPVLVRFRWTRAGRDAARWEQAFSYAGGPWETNWTMELERLPGRSKEDAGPPR